MPVGQPSSPQTVSVTLQASGTAAAPLALTQGVPTSEFAVADGGSCAAGTAYTAGQTCTVQVVFTPRFPGRRLAAVVLKNAGGELLGSTQLLGSSTGSLPRLSPGRIDTVAGDRSWVFASDGVSAVGAPIFLPQGLAVDAAGNLFISDSGNSRIRRVDAVSGHISTVVGTGAPGYSGDGAQGTATAVNQPAGLALDGAGDLYFADSGNGLVRRLDAASGQVSTVAGAPASQGYTGDGGLATAASLTLPEGIAFDDSGNLLIADSGNNSIRLVDATTGRIRTLAGTGIAGFSGDGGPATQGRISGPWSLLVAPDGSILFADFSNDRVRRISAGGTLSTVAGTGARGFSGDGGSPTQAALDAPTALAMDPAGDLYIADSGNNRVRMINVADGTIQTLAGNTGDSFTGDGGPADQASLYGPYALLFDAGANLFVADMFHNRVRRISGQDTTIHFATIRVSKTSQPQAQGLANSGNAALTLGTPGLVNAALDATTSSCLTGAVAPATLCNLGVEFAPGVIGAQVAGSVTVNTDSGATAPVITVEGEVLSVEPTATVLTVSANPALVGAALTLTATVTSDDTSRSGQVSFLEGQHTLCTATLNAGGIASCSTSALALGSHSLVASYAGDANNASSVSPAVTEVIKQAPQLLLEATPNPATVTAAVMLKLTASAPTGTPTGTVSFYDGTALLATAVLNSAGVATLSNNQLSPGTHTLTVQYAGDPTNASGTSNPVSETVNQASTATNLGSSNSTVTVGDNLTLAAVVSSASGPIPTGAVTFNEGAAVLGTATLDSTGKATLISNSLTPGSHGLSVAYSGDTNSASSTSAVLAQTIAQITTLTTVTPSANPLSAGAVLHLNAAVALAQGAIAVGWLTGTLTFSDGTTVLGTDVLDANGHATLAVPGLSVATHTITATYTGSTNYAPSTSAAFNEVVSSTPTTISLSTSTQSALAGKPVTFSLTVSSTTGIPTGTVTLRDGSAIVGQAALTNGGAATFSLSSLSVGSHTLSVNYAGDANYSPSTSSSTGVSIALALPALTLSTPATTINAGTTASFTATLSSDGVLPAGTLTLKDGSAAIATQPVGSGTLRFFTDGLAIGPHVLTVVYGGDANNASATSNTLNVVVQQAPTTTALTGSSPVTLGSNVSLTAGVTSSSPHLTGSVNFLEGATTLGTGVLAADGTAHLVLSTLAAGDHTLIAVFSGDPTHATSTASALRVRVVRPSMATLTSTANPAVSGTPVTLVAKIAAAGSDLGSSVPSGQVTFTDGSTSLGTATLDATGTATLSSTALNVGVHAIQVTFSGDANFAAAAAALNQSVTSASTQVNLSVAQNPATYGLPLAFTTAVKSNGGAATGSLDLLDGTVRVGTVILDSNGGAQLTLSILTPGAHSLTASYRGDGKASASVSGPLSLVVKQTTTAVLSSSANPASTLSPVQLTVAIGNAGAASATGSVTFVDGTNSLGTAPLDGDGRASIALPQMTAGAHTITASYAGDDANFASTASPLTQTIVRRSTSTALTSSATNTNNPQQVTLIALVRGDGSVLPGGAVAFQSGSTLVGTSTVDSTGVATLTIQLETKQESITASYGGDASYLSSASSSDTVTAGAATQFTLQVNPGTISVVTKQHVSVTLTLQSVKGFNDTLKMGCLGLPFAATCTFSSPEMKLAADGTASVQLMLDTGNPLGSGAQTAQLHGGASRTVLLCLLPFGLVFACGRKGRTTAKLSKLLVMLFATALTLAASGCAGLQMNGTPPGTYTLKVTASGAGTGATQSQTVVLTVTE